MLIKKTHRFLEVLLAIFVLYLLLTRALITWAQAMPEPFVNSVEWLTGSEVDFSQLAIEQDWLGFDVHIENLKVNRPEWTVNLGLVKLDINVFAPFWPSLDYGASLELKDGSIQMPQLSSSVDAAQTLSASQWLEQIKFEKLNITRLWKRIKLENIRLNHLNQLTRPGQFLHIYNLHALKAAHLHVVSEVGLGYAPALNNERFNIKARVIPNVWGQVVEAQLSLAMFEPLSAQQLAHNLPAKWRDILPTGEVLMDVQATVSNARLAEVTLQLYGQSLRWPQHQTALPSSLGLAFNWQAGFKETHVSLANIQINNRYVKSLAPIEITLDEHHRVNFKAERFDIEPFKVMVAALAPNESIAKLFGKTAQLEMANLSGQLKWQELSLPYLSFDMVQLDIPATDYPGLALSKLTVVKQAHILSLSTPAPLFITQPSAKPLAEAKPIQVTLPASLTLTRDATTRFWQLAPAAFKFDKVDAVLQGQAHLDGRVDANLAFSAESLEPIKAHLPYHLMSQELQHWLKKGLVSGQAIRGEVVLQGDLAHFPFKNGQGTFRAQAQLDKVKLLFDEAWPMLEDFSAKLFFTPYTLRIESAEVMVGEGVLAKNVAVEIDHLDSADIAVNISGQVDAPMAKATRYLTRSPLAKNIGLNEFLQGDRQFAGDVAVVLNQIWVPVLGYDQQVEKVDGQVTFKNASLNLANTLQLSNLQGALRFNEHSVSAQRLTADVLGGKAEFAIKTEANAKQVTINGAGLASLPVSGLFEKPLSWQANVNIPFGSSSSASSTGQNRSTEKPIYLNVTADVSAANSLMPEPLSASNLRNKTLSATVEIAKDTLDLNASLPNVVSLQSAWREQSQAAQTYQLQNAHLHWGQSAKNTVSQNGLRVDGMIPVLDASGWSEFYSRVIQPQLSEQSDQAWPQWQASTLHVNALHYKESVYPKLTLAWKTQADRHVELDLTGPDVVAHAIWNPIGQVDLNVTHLTLYTPKESAATESSFVQNSQENGTCKAGVSKRIFPQVNFYGQSIFIDERLIDQLTFTFNDDLENLALNDIKGTFGGNAAEFTGQYQYNKQSQLSDLNVKVQSQDVEAVTDFIGLEKGFTGKKATASTHLNWNGSADCFTTQAANGTLNFTLNDGAIADIEPGFARLLGLLSVDSLARRLKFDLNDLTNKGMTYDSIDGIAHLQAGLLTFETFQIKAPAANVKLFGDVDLLKESFELKADVTPTISGSLPTIAALAGAASPVTALAMYAIMKIIPGLTEELITYHYKITGPWKTPVVTELSQADKTNNQIKE